jgi:site-specific recombinase xerD
MSIGELYKKSCKQIVNQFGRRYFRLENQENILDLYYNKHLKQKDIATMVGVSKQYVSKVIKSDSRCKGEKQIRKNTNAIKRKDYMKEYFKNYDRPKKKDNSYEQLQALLNQDSLELSYMNTALKEAVIAEIIPSNPMDRIESVKKEVFIPEFYTDDELIELIEVIKTQKLELPLTLGIIYGLRREEILGLTWIAIDFKNKSITIRKTVGRGKYDGVTQFLIKDIPKNKSSYRTLPMFDFIADLLKKYKEKYKLNEKIFGNTYITDYKDFICLMDNGELVKPDYVDRTFSRILKENGFRHIRLHDLRHSCATLLLRNGVPLPEIQKWLGHSNIITTQRYSHLDQNDKSIPANMIETKFNMSFISNDNKKEQISIGTR